VLRSICRNHNPVLSSFMAYHRVYNKSNTMGPTSGAGTAYPSGSLGITPGFYGVRVAQSLDFCVVFCRSLFVLFRLAIVLSFFNLHLMITTLVSSNSSLVSILIFLHDGCYWWSRNYLPFRNAWVHFRFLWSSCCSIYILYVFSVVFCRSLFVLLSFSFWS